VPELRGLLTLKELSKHVEMFMRNQQEVIVFAKPGFAGGFHLPLHLDRKV
jgi:hypothetical protein